jgi:hypothetical protein
MRFRTTFLAIALATPLAAAAQSPAQAVATPAPVVPAVPSVIPVGSRVGLLPSAYDDGGRRDPFGSLVTPRRSATPTSIDSARPRTGLASLALADIAVTGISRVGDARLAILAGPNKQSYVARAKDRLFDAVIVSIDGDGVTFSEQIDGSRATQQVRRSLRPAGEGIR